MAKSKKNMETNKHNHKDSLDSSTCLDPTKNWFLELQLTSSTEIRA